MTIANGNTIEIADLNSAYTTILSNLQADNATLPANFWLNFQFSNLTSSVTSPWNVRKVVLPDDYILTEVCITSGEHSGTLTVTVDNGAMIETISISEAVTSPGFDEVTRYYSDTNKPVQLLLKGSELTVTCSTTSGSSGSTIQVSVGLLSEWRRS
jgi:hypothetical protein